MLKNGSHLADLSVFLETAQTAQKLFLSDAHLGGDLLVRFFHKREIPLHGPRDLPVDFIEHFHPPPYPSLNCTLTLYFLCEARFKRSSTPGSARISARILRRISSFGVSSVNQRLYLPSRS